MAASPDGLSDHLLPSSAGLGLEEESAAPVRRGMDAATKKKVLLSVAAFLAVAAVVGVVAGTVASRSSSAPAASSSSSSSSLAASSGTNMQIVVMGKTFQARPSFAGALGSLASAPPPTVYHQGAHTSSARFSFRHTTVDNSTGRVSHTHLTYDVEKSNHAHCLSNHASVQGVYCAQGNSLALLFANHTAALSFAGLLTNGTILFLRREWQCGEHVRQFVTAPTVQGRVLLVKTINVTVAQAFKRASISFFTNHSSGGPGVAVKLPLTHPKPPRRHRAATTTATTAPQHQRRSFWSSLGNFFSGAVGGLLQAAVTGAATFDMPYSSSYALPSLALPFGTSTAGGSVNFDAQLDFNTDVNLQIQSYSVASFAATVTATVDADLGLSLNAQAAYSSSTAQPQQLTNAALSSGTINVFGIPLSISLALTTYGSYAVSLQGSATAAGSVNVQGTMEGGIQYTGSSGAWTPIGTSSLSATPNWGSPQMGSSGTLTTQLYTVLALNVAYVGGPQAVLTLTGDVYGSEQANTDDDCMSLTADAQAEVEVGENVNLQIAGIQVISQQQPLQPVYGPTTVWSDTLTPSCT